MLQVQVEDSVQAVVDGLEALSDSADAQASGLDLIWALFARLPQWAGALDEPGYLRIVRAAAAAAGGQAEAVLPEGAAAACRLLAQAAAKGERGLPRSLDSDVAQALAKAACVAPAACGATACFAFRLVLSARGAASSELNALVAEAAAAVLDHALTELLQASLGAGPNTAALQGAAVAVALLGDLAKNAESALPEKIGSRTSEAAAECAREMFKAAPAAAWAAAGGDSSNAAAAAPAVTLKQAVDSATLAARVAKSARDKRAVEAAAKKAEREAQRVLEANQKVRAAVAAERTGELAELVARKDIDVAAVLALRDTRGRTALQEACRAGKPVSGPLMVQLLVKHGGRSSLLNVDAGGLSCVDDAAVAGHVHIFEALKPDGVGRVARDRGTGAGQSAGTSSAVYRALAVRSPHPVGCLPFRLPRITHSLVASTSSDRAVLFPPQAGNGVAAIAVWVRGSAKPHSALLERLQKEAAVRPTCLPPRAPPICAPSGRCVALRAYGGLLFSLSARDTRDVRYSLCNSPCDRTRPSPQRAASSSGRLPSREGPPGSRLALLARRWGKPSALTSPSWSRRRARRWRRRRRTGSGTRWSRPRSPSRPRATPWPARLPWRGL